ncbi:MAG: hypothetical protein IJ666_07955 [Ruminococcus sp.]|nr:hypothetical protein [Ruminococcus sp.]
MKKLVSFLSAAAVLMSASCSTAAAENSADLYELAASLGADTDYINIPDKFYKDIYYDELAAIGKYNIARYQPIVSTSLSDMVSSKVWNYYSDSSLGTSILEILSHNGNILPADIKQGADTLSAIDSYDEIKDNIEYYSSWYDNRIFRLYHNYLLNRRTKEERVDMLLDMAEKSMTNGKYFLIMYGCYMEKMGDISVDEEDGNYMVGYDSTEKTYIQQVHSSAGIGITDGKWEFNGKSYDKCVLTVDNLAEKGFSEDTCLYINSQTKEFYVPAFANSVQGELQLVSFDDTDMLNFNGNIKPTQDYHVENIDITGIGLSSKRTTILNLTAEDIDGNKESFDEKPYENQYYNHNRYFCLKGKKVDFTFVEDWSDEAYFTVYDNNQYADIGLKKQDAHVTLDNGAFTFRREVIDDNIYHKPGDQLHIDMDLRYAGVETSPANAPIWDFSTDIMDDIKLTPAENGFYAETSGSAVLTYYILSYIGDEYKSGSYPPEADTKGASGSVKLSGNKVLISLKDGCPCVYYDSDNDGVFDDEFARGDTNCDGKVDSADASAVMQKYASISSMPEEIAKLELEHNTVSPYYDFNGDGIIDASDASAILAEYAKSST